MFTEFWENVYKLFIKILQKKLDILALYHAKTALDAGEGAAQL